MLLMLFIGYLILNSTVFGAKAVAERYVAHIAAGEFSQANALVPPGEEHARLLSDEAAPDAAGRITDVSLQEHWSGVSDTKTVNVSYTLGSHRITQSLRMARSGSRALIFSDWKVSTPMTHLLTLNYSDNIQSPIVNGVQVSRSDARHSDEQLAWFAAYPGIYKVSFAQSRFYTVQPNHVEIAVGVPGTLPTRLMTRPTRALTEEIDARIVKYVNECARSSGERTVKDCPLTVRSSKLPSTGQMRNGSWKIEAHPRSVALDAHNGRFRTVGGIATYTFEYRAKESDPWKKRSVTVNMRDFSGKFSIKGDAIDIKFE